MVEIAHKEGTRLTPWHDFCFSERRRSAYQEPCHELVLWLLGEVNFKDCPSPFCRSVLNIIWSLRYAT
jgi:hypothetical protein